MKRATANPGIYIKVEVLISIHALVKRATIIGKKGILLPLNFNPRPREEGDGRKTPSKALADNFNPRPREEGDRENRGNVSIPMIFQSTPS